MMECFEALYYQLKQNENFDVYFWGASSFLEEFLSKYNIEEFQNIKGIIDTNEEKSGTKLGKYTIVSPREINTEKHTKVIFAIKNNATAVYNVINRKINIINSNIELLPNIFEQINKDSLIDKINSNKIYLINSRGERKEVSFVPNLRVEWWGSNSVIEIEGWPNFRNSKIYCSDSCYVRIANTPYLVENLTAVLNQSNEKLIIGRNFSCVSCYINFGMESNLEVNIGNDCMFSKQIDIRPADSHIIYDLENKKVQNKSSKINIGNHVWVGLSSLILKNVNIPDNSIVGARSVVTKKFIEKNIAIAGNPAKIVKRNINWVRPHISEFNEEDEMNV